MEKQWDVFISHAFEDKKDFVEPLAESLRKLGARVWYDKFSLSVGDGLRKSIDEGLINSSFGVVVLSPNFLSKSWTNYELDGLLQKEFDGNKPSVLPIWHKISRQDLMKYSPSLVNKFALLSNDKTPDEIAETLLRQIRPDIFADIHKRNALNTIKSKSEVQINKTEDVKLEISPILHEQLSNYELNIIRLIRATSWGFKKHSMKYWVNGFRRDIDPSTEILWWTHFLACFWEYLFLDNIPLEKQEQVAECLLLISSGNEKSSMYHNLYGLPEDTYEKLKSIYENKNPLYDLDEDYPS